MSRISKWKLEKTKVKVVFRLQFHATHIPQSGWDKLFISFIPAESGKATAKTTKANVRNGSCKWGDPIYETTRLLQDSKSKQYDEKLYKLVVAMGSSRASTLGDVVINLADFVDALKPSTVALPLQGCNFGTTLHITVQLLTSKTGFREFEQQRELRERGLQSGIDSHEHRVNAKTQDVASSQTDKVRERIKLKQDANELTPFEEDGNVNEESADSATGFDVSSQTSGSLYAEKHEIDSLKSTASGDPVVVSHFQSPETVTADSPNGQNMAQGGTSQGWGSDNSVNKELAMSCKENNRLRESLELAESSFFNLKLEVSSLQSLADDLGAETQKFSHQLEAEISATEKLEKEVSVMRSECSKFKDDIMKLKDLKLSPQIPITETNDNHVNDLVRNMQVDFSNKIALVDMKIRELQNKAYAFSPDGEAKFMFSELEELLNFLIDFEVGTGDAKTSLKVLSSVKTDVRDEHFVSENGLGLDLCQPESHLYSASQVCKDGNTSGGIEAINSQIFDLVRELDEAKIEKDTTTRKMHEMECYYEALVLDLEETQKRLLGELQLLRSEHSTCLYTLSSRTAEMESMRADMNRQMLKFVDERQEQEALNKELERRATTLEAALRRARLNYSIAVDKLQKDLELLSSQVMSMFQTNENLIKQALPAQPHLEGDVEVFMNTDDTKNPSEFQKDNLGSRRRSVGGDVLLEDLKRSFCLQEELYQKVEAELIEMHSINLYLDIYSKSLQESLREADTDIRSVEKQMSELIEELKFSNASQNQLMARLQKANDDIHVLNEFKSNSFSQCSDMTLQNQLLEDKFVNVSKENDGLAQKLKDCENTLMEYRSYQTKYEACLVENAELSHRLKHEAFENEKLRDEVLLVKENLTILKSESDLLVSLKDNLEETIGFVQDKVADLLEYYNKQPCFSATNQSLKLETSDIKDAVQQLERFQHSACDKLCQLMEENHNLRVERDIAGVSLSTVRSEILAVKQKFKNDMTDVTTKLDMSNALVEKLQAELESVASKLHSSSETKEKHTQQSKLLLADLAFFEDQINELTCSNGHFARDISGLDALAEELERSKVTIAELMHDKHELSMCLQGKTEESINLSSENSGLKEDSKNLRDELHREKSFKDELEVKVRDLTSQLITDKDNLHTLELQQTELKMCLLGKSEESIKLSCEISDLKEDLEKVNRELNDEKVHKGELEEKIRDLTSQLNKDQDKLLIFEQQKSELAMCLQTQSGESIQLSNEINNLKEELKILQGKLHEEKAFNGDLEAIIRDLTSQLTRNEEKFHILEQQKAEVEMCLQGKTEESMKLVSEISGLRILQNELQQEKTFKDDLEAKVRDLSSHLSMEQEKLLNVEQLKTELVHIKEAASVLELEKSRLANLLSQQNVLVEELKTNNSYQSGLESQLLEMFDYSLAVDVKFIFVSNQYETQLRELMHKLVSSEGGLAELQKKYQDTDSMLNQCLAREAIWTEQKTNLLDDLNSLRSELQVCGAQNNVLSESNVETRDCCQNLAMMGTRFSSNYVLQICEAEWMKNMMIEAEEEILFLSVSKDEQEMLVTILKGKIDELSADVTMVEAYRGELETLRSQCCELSYKLSEQVLKSEEFKNLSIRLKELKDKAEAECLVARERRETEVPAAAADSLRIAFIKEQYESKNQELKHQVAVSKKHGEELLLKLQDAIDEVENRKKSEAMNFKRIEELSVRLSILESELESALAEKWEKNSAYDRMKAELECALLSLDCCKEEKDKIESSLLELEEEKSRLATELTMSKRQLKNLNSSNKFERGEYDSETEVEHEANGATEDSPPVLLDRDEPTHGEIMNLTEVARLQSFRDAAPLDLHRILELEEFKESNGKSLELNGEHLGVQSLKSSFENLHEELERMKNENTIFDIGPDADQDFQVPQREIMKLHKANEELRSMFPLFNEISSGGNALERVLALEIELAEALKVKNKSNVQFQSSFLRQHSDEEAVLKSFRDINELIQETLDLKGRHTVMEAELREMHDRYTQLSLQFAEVEGERQKLKMTLKNVRPRKLVSTINRSSSMDHHRS